MFAEAAIGDAAGFCYEFSSAEFVAANNDPDKGYVHHPDRPHIPGTYSDDAQMGIALAMAMLRAGANGGSWRDLTAHKIASEFVFQFKADPRVGYSKGFQEILTSLVAKFPTNPDLGAEFLKGIKPHSRKSGGMMRAWPCGLLPTIEEAIDLAVFQASLTHATQEGVDSAAAVAILVWCCRQGMSGDDILGALHILLPGYPWRIPWQGPVSTSGIEAARAAISLICHHTGLDSVQKSMKTILWAAIEYTGDVDTVACVALAAASVHPEIVNDLPKVLYKDFEKGKYGLDFLRSLDKRMMALFPTPSSKVPSVEKGPVESECGIFELFNPKD